MLTVNCPNCKRALQAPEESGDHRVVCPGCKADFTVVFEEGAVRAQPTAIIAEQRPEQPARRSEADEPPEWVPTVERDVYFDEYGARTKIVHRTFLITTALGTALGLILIDPNDLTLGTIVLLAAISAFGAIFVTIGVGAVLVPHDAELRPEEVLRNRRRRWRQESAQLDLPAESDIVIDAPNDPRAESPPIEPSQTTVQPKEPPS